MRDVSGRQRGVLVGQSPLMARVKATAVGQRICHVLRSVEAVFVDQGPQDSGQWHAVADVGSSGVEASASVCVWRTCWCVGPSWLACGWFVVEHQSSGSIQ